MTAGSLRDRLSVGLVCASMVGLLGCGGASSTTTPAVSSTTTPAVSSAATSSASPAAHPSATSGPTASPEIGVCLHPAPIKFDPKATIDLTGAWAGDDGGIYYVRQLDKVVWWNGMSERAQPARTLGRDWNNVGRGEIKDDLTIVSDWVDVPRGGINGSGTVNFKIGADSAGNLQITKSSETGSGRGDTVWTRCTPGFPG